MKNSHPNTIGDRWLSAWLVAPGVCWIQTREPKFAKKLSRQRDGRLVARGVSGGFLRTFEFPHSLAWARKLVARYQSAEMVTNEAFSRLERPLARRKGKAV